MHCISNKIDNRTLDSRPACIPSSTKCVMRSKLYSFLKTMTPRINYKAITALFVIIYQLTSVYCNTKINNCIIDNDTAYYIVYSLYDKQLNINETDTIRMRIDKSVAMCYNDRCMYPYIHYIFKKNAGLCNYYTMSGSLGIVNKTLIKENTRYCGECLADLDSFNISYRVFYWKASYPKFENLFLGSSLICKPYNFLQNNIYGAYDEYVFIIRSDPDKDYNIKMPKKFKHSYVEYCFSPALGFMWSKRYYKGKLIGELKVNYLIERSSSKTSVYPIIRGESSTISITNNLPLNLINYLLHLYNNRIFDKHLPCCNKCKP